MTNKRNFNKERIVYVLIILTLFLAIWLGIYGLKKKAKQVCGICYSSGYQDAIDDVKKGSGIGT